MTNIDHRRFYRFLKPFVNLRSSSLCQIFISFYWPVFLMFYLLFCYQASNLIFQKFLWRYQHLVEKYSITCVQMTFRFKVYHCFPIVVFRCPCILSSELRPSSLFNRTNIIHITISLSRRINISCMKFKSRTRTFYNIAAHSLYELVAILLTSWKHFLTSSFQSEGRFGP